MKKNNRVIINYILINITSLDKQSAENAKIVLNVLNSDKTLVIIIKLIPKHNFVILSFYNGLILKDILDFSNAKIKLLN